MAKIIYTEVDIIDLVNRGITTLEINDDIILTDLAREMAFNHGIRFIRTKLDHPEDNEQAALIHRVKAAIIARLGDQVDPLLLDTAVAKVLKDMK